MAYASFLLRLFKSQYLASLPPLNHDFTDQVIIVTGSNTGLGLEAVRHFVRLNAAKVIIACRTASKGETAKLDVEQSLLERKGVVEVWPLDLCSYASVKAFAERATKELDRIDVLLENAGLSTMKWSMAEDNETTITTNVVSTFLLGLLLLPKLKETEAKTGLPPRLVIVSSDTHEAVDFAERHSESIFGHLNDRSKLNRRTMGTRYSKSKLLEILTVRALTESHAPKGYPVVINYVNPGFCQSEIMREVEWARKTMYFILNARSSAVGGGLLVAAATMSKESHGKYVSNGRLAEPSKWVRSEDGRKTGERVWQELELKLEKIEPGIMSKL